MSGSEELLQQLQQYGSDSNATTTATMMAATTTTPMTTLISTTISNKLAPHSPQSHQIRMQGRENRDTLNSPTISGIAVSLAASTSSPQQLQHQHQQHQQQQQQQQHQLQQQAQQLSFRTSSPLAIRSSANMQLQGAVDVFDSSDSTSRRPSMGLAVKRQCLTNSGYMGEQTEENCASGALMSPETRSTGQADDDIAQETQPESSHEDGSLEGAGENGGAECTPNEPIQLLRSLSRRGSNHASLIIQVPSSSAQCNSPQQFQPQPQPQSQPQSQSQSQTSGQSHTLAPPVHRRDASSNSILNTSYGLLNESYISVDEEGSKSGMSLLRYCTVVVNPTAAIANSLGPVKEEPQVPHKEDAVHASASTPEKPPGSGQKRTIIKYPTLPAKHGARHARLASEPAIPDLLPIYHASHATSTPTREPNSGGSATPSTPSRTLTPRQLNYLCSDGTHVGGLGAIADSPKTRFSPASPMVSSRGGIKPRMSPAAGSRPNPDPQCTHMQELSLDHQSTFERLLTEPAPVCSIASSSVASKSMRNAPGTPRSARSLRSVDSPARSIASLGTPSIQTSTASRSRVEPMQSPSGVLSTAVPVKSLALLSRSTSLATPRGSAVAQPTPLHASPAKSRHGVSPTRPPAAPTVAEMFTGAASPMARDRFIATRKVNSRTLDENLCPTLRDFSIVGLEDGNDAPDAVVDTAALALGIQRVDAPTRAALAALVTDPGSGANADLVCGSASATFSLAASVCRARTTSQPTMSPIATLSRQTSLRAGANASNRSHPNDYVQSSSTDSQRGVSIALDSTPGAPSAATSAGTLRRIVSAAPSPSVASQRRAQQKNQGHAPTSEVVGSNGLLLSSLVTSDPTMNPVVSDFNNLLAQSLFEGREAESSSLAFGNEKSAVADSITHLNDIQHVYSTNLAADAPQVRPLRPYACKVLDAPDLVNDYYLNLVDWSPAGSSGLLAVALREKVFLWDSQTANVSELCQNSEANIITSVKWNQSGKQIAVGSANGEVSLYDGETLAKIFTVRHHRMRASAMAFNGDNWLTTGGRDRSIIHLDVRAPGDPILEVKAGHTEEVCGLAWSLDGLRLASGSNDNTAVIWERSMLDSPAHVLAEHRAAVKALAWCPFNRNILATGAGSADRHIRIYDASTGTLLSATDTQSQVCALLWNAQYQELLSAHGFSKNQLTLWSYPNMTPIANFTGHTARVLFMSASGDGKMVCSAGADETLRLWNVWDAAEDSSPSSSMTNTASTSATPHTPNRAPVASPLRSGVATVTSPAAAARGTSASALRGAFLR